MQIKFYYQKVHFIMQSNSFRLIFKSKVIRIPFKFIHLSDLPENILISLITVPNHQYQVKSNVCEEVFGSFIKYLVDNKLPDITINNINEYIELNSEFQLLSHIIEQKKEQLGEFMINLNGILNHQSNDTSYYEKEIAAKLDIYIENYNETLMKLPIHALFNIFYHKQRILTNHNQAYEQIIKYFKTTQNPSIFILLDSLDGKKLNRENLENSIALYNEHFNHIPRIDITYILNLEDRLSELTKKFYEYKIQSEMKLENIQKEIIQEHQREMDKLKEENQKEKNELSEQIRILKEKIIEIQKNFNAQSIKDSDLIGKKFYIVHSFKSNDNKEYALDNGGSENSQFRLYEWTKGKSDQIFTMLENGTIMCVDTGFVLDVTGAMFRNETLLHSVVKNNSDAQLWTYDCNKKMLKLKNQNFCLNIHCYQLVNNATINIWNPADHKCQMWDIRFC